MAKGYYSPEISGVEKSNIYVFSLRKLTPSISSTTLASTNKRAGFIIKLSHTIYSISAREFHSDRLLQVECNVTRPRLVDL